MELTLILLERFSLLLVAFIISGRLVSAALSSSSKPNDPCTATDTGKAVSELEFLRTFMVEYTMFCNQKTHKVEVESCRRTDKEAGKKENEPYYPGEAFRYHKQGTPDQQHFGLCNTHAFASKVISYTGLRCEANDEFVSEEDSVDVNGIAVRIKHECAQLPGTPALENGVSAANNRFWQVVQCKWWSPAKGDDVKWLPGKTTTINNKNVLCSKLLPPTGRPVAVPNSWKGGKGQAFKTQEDRINGWAAAVKAANGNYIKW